VKSWKRMISLLVIGCLIFGFSGQMLAANHIKTSVSPDGRAQIIFEFDDLKEAEWAMEYIAKMKSKNVFDGFEDGTFRPNQPVTRAQAIVTAVRLMGLEEQAKAQPTNAKLNFKDAEHIERQYAWAKGYILVALENGLFDPTEDKLLPDKPASRLWVSSLLVKSLGLKDEALRQMTKAPNFKDANQIPAASVGYINVAIEHGIVSGYPDGTFQPNRNVTRAEMAALLDRTNDGLLENAGATRVIGTIKSIHFAASGQQQPMQGRITILTPRKELLTYAITADLLVQHQHQFIRANQLTMDDTVLLVIQNQKVIDAVLLDDIDGSYDSAIRSFELEIEMFNKEELKMAYEKKGNKVEAEVEWETKTNDQKIKGYEAVEFIQKLIDHAGINEKMSKKEAVSHILYALSLNKGQVKEMELEIKFSNGKELKVEFEHDDDD